MKRKIALLLLAILIFLFSVACGRKTENTEKTTDFPKTEKNTNTIRKAANEKIAAEKKITIGKTTAEREVAWWHLLSQMTSVIPSAITSAATSAASITPCENKQIFDLTDSNVKEVLDAYLAVWNQNADIIDAYNNEKNRAALKKYLTYINRNVIAYFAVIDLDKDGLPEVVLPCSYDKNTDADFYCILYYREGRVYYLTQGSKSFGDLKIDGTFRWISGHSTGGYATISFIADKQENWPFTLDRFTYHDYYGYIGETETGEPIWMQFDNIVNHQKATEAEYKAACEIQDNKPNIIWHELTDAEIEQYFPE